MSKLEPIIKFNGGAPVALCNRCFTIICYVSCPDYSSENISDCTVSRPYRDDSVSKGDKLPIHCDKCKELLKYTLNE